MTIISKRVSENPSASAAKRVNYFDAVSDSFSDPWNGSWANSWGNSWKIVTTGTRAEPEVNTTKWISSSPSENITKRVTGI